LLRPGEVPLFASKCPFLKESFIPFRNPRYHWGWQTPVRERDQADTKWVIHEGISAFSVWTQCGLLSPQSLANFAEIRFRSAILT
jgi:hypothetical protein